MSPSHTDQRFFGTDGVRGRVGDEPITPQTVMKLGWAAGRVLSDDRRREGKVIIGKDTRVSGYLLESALEAGLSAAGVDISLLGPMPTPGIAYLTCTARALAGIVISASHNQYEDNGIKFFSPNGAKLPDAVELDIERMMQRPMVLAPPAQLGKAERFPDAAGRYIEFCKSAIPHKLTLNDLRIVLDCAHGAAYHVAPNVFEELGADVIAVADRPDGFNINRDCGSTHPEMLMQKVREIGADIGIALDGDGDRVLLVDHEGGLVDGDQILYILATTRKQIGRLHGGVVGTLMSNLGLEQACERHRISFRRAAVGDRHVLALLGEEGWDLGGETSGHIICLDKSTTGDGIIAALQVLQAMVEGRTPLVELKRGMEVFPQTMINVPLPEQTNSLRLDVGASKTIQSAVREAEAELSHSGRIVLRPSGTEPVIRVMVEGRDRQQVNRIGRQLADVVKSAAAAGDGYRATG